jgi:multiple sugar transport system ATP-binding protein
MSALKLEGLGKRFGDVDAVRDLTLEVQPGEILALLGSSGAGKSTTLKMAAGVERPSDGRVLIGPRDVTREPAWRRNAAMVFESYVLYPQRSVFDNIAFPLRAPALRGRYDHAEVQRRVDRVARPVAI